MPNLLGTDSYVLTNGSRQNITEHSVCRYVINSTGKSILVPTKTSGEWSSFYTNVPTNVTVSTICAPTGTPDTAFNGTGMVQKETVAGQDDRVFQIKRDGNGKFVAVGMTNNGTSYQMTIWRYNADGTLDTTFNSPNGYRVHDHSAGVDYGSDVAVDSNNDYIITGSTSYRMTVWKVKNDGTLDTAGFGNPNGYYRYATYDSEGFSVGIDAGGKIYVSGRLWDVAAGVTGPENDMAVWKFNTNGTLDTGFNTTGIKFHGQASGCAVALTGSYDIGRWFTFDSGGSLIIAGTANPCGGLGDEAVIWKLTSTGSFDTTFGEDNYTSPDISYGTPTGGADATPDGFTFDGNYPGVTANKTDIPHFVTTDSSGKILLCGAAERSASNYDFFIARYTASGILDTTFATNGVYSVNNISGGNAADSCRKLAFDSYGNIIAAGYSTTAGTISEIVVMRFSPDGIIDTTFGTSGIYKITTGFLMDDAYADSKGKIGLFVDQSTNKIYIAGMVLNTGSNRDLAIWAIK